MPSHCARGSKPAAPTHPVTARGRLVLRLKCIAPQRTGHESWASVLRPHEQGVEAIVVWGLSHVHHLQPAHVLVTSDVVHDLAAVLLSSLGIDVAPAHVGQVWARTQAAAG